MLPRSFETVVLWFSPMVSQTSELNMDDGDTASLDVQRKSYTLSNG